MSDNISKLTDDKSTFSDIKSDITYNSQKTGVTTKSTKEKMVILEDELEEEKKKRLELENQVMELKSMVESLTNTNLNSSVTESKAESEVASNAN